MYILCRTFDGNFIYTLFIRLDYIPPLVLYYVMSGLYLEKKETAHVHGTITARKGVFGICFILGPMSIALYTERENLECLERMLLTKTRPNIQYHVMIKKGVSVYMHS